MEVPIKNLCTTLEKMLYELGSASMSKEGEGSVVYLNSGGTESQVLSIFKLKTLDYHLFRRMREILK